MAEIPFQAKSDAPVLVIPAETLREELEELESLRAAVERVRTVHPEEFMGVEETWPVCGSCRDAYEGADAVSVSDRARARRGGVMGEQATCIETASCEEGDHTYSWPCDLASTDEEGA